MCEKNYSALADWIFKLVKLFYSYSVYFYEAESRVIFPERSASVFEEYEY